MGTNYYAVTSGKLLTEDSIEEAFHIGKNSYGWVFHFQAHPELDIVDLESMKEYLEDKDIYDEYCWICNPADFWDIVKRTKLPLKDGRKRKVLMDPDYPQPLLKGDYEESGFAWSTIPFS